MNQYKITRVLKIIIVNAFVLLGLFVLVEVILRSLGIGYGSAPHNPNSIYHHVNPKSYEFTVHDPNNEFGGHNVYYNEFGHRYNPSRKAHTESMTKWFFLGDSFTASAQAEYEDSFVGIIEKKYPDIEIVNFGTSSYSPVIYYLLIKNEILNKQNLPSLICIQLYSNDIRDDENYIKQAIFNSDGELIAVDGGNPNWMIQILRKSYLIRLVRKSQLTIKFLLQNKSLENTNVIGNYVEEVSILNNTISETYLLKIANLLRSSNIKLYLTAIPSKYQCIKKDYKGTVSFSDNVKDWSREQNIEFIDATDAFSNHMLNDGALPFYMDDIHLNEIGNELFGNVLIENLK